MYERIIIAYLYFIRNGMNGAFATFTALKIVIGSNFNVGRYRIAFIQYIFNCRVITRAALKSDLNERAGCSAAYRIMKK